jgi:hypothetical protein
LPPADTFGFEPAWDSLQYLAEVHNKGGSPMKRCALLAAIVAVVATASVFAPTVSAAPPTAAITQTIGGTTATGLNLTGTLSNLRFVNQNGQVVLTGVLNGQVTNAVGDVLRTITNQLVTLPIIGAAGGGSCTILDLTLGPLHLDLLGLVVDLNQVHLTITAESGNGKLLGNLLCGIANALNGNGGGLANLLNKLLGL